MIYKQRNEWLVFFWKKKLSSKLDVFQKIKQHLAKKANIISNMKLDSRNSVIAKPLRIKNKQQLYTVFP